MTPYYEENGITIYYGDCRDVPQESRAVITVVNEGKEAMQRLKTWLINIPNIPAMIAFRVLRRAIRKDPAYAEGWQSNIAMAIYDESRPQCICEILDGEFKGHRPDCSIVRAHNAKVYEPLSHEFCNNATARFMNLCFGVDTRRSCGR